MAIIETKFSIGDVVYYASTTTERKQHPCPDCLGTKKWKAVSPAGGEYEFSCPRCRSGYRSENELSLDYSIFVPVSHRLTIGSVRTDSADKTQYMCVETGIGSGNLYDESRLFSTEGEALVAAQALANKSNDGDVPWVAQQYNKTLKVCDYQLNDGREHVERTRANHLAWQIKDLRDEIAGCESMGDVANLVKSFE